MTITTAQRPSSMNGGPMPSLLQRSRNIEELASHTGGPTCFMDAESLPDESSMTKARSWETWNALSSTSKPSLESRAAMPSSVFRTWG